MAVGAVAVDAEKASRSEVGETLGDAEKAFRSEVGETPANQLNVKVTETPPDHLNIKVTDNHNEVFFKIKRTTRLEKLMIAFCERQGKSLGAVRFLFEGQRVQKDDTPDTLEMQDGDMMEVHQEQLGGSVSIDTGLC